MKTTFGLIALILFSIGCNDSTPSADRELQIQTENAMKEANRQVGMPGIVNFQEKKLMKQIYELRDQENLICYAYYLDLYGNKHFLGQCIGYGLPYSTQFSNPQKVVDVGRSSYHWMSLPQPEPNGLFMPDGLAATWLLLIDPKTGTPHPVYVEPTIIVSPFKLHE